jgi:hypothetical protein
VKADESWMIHAFLRGSTNYVYVKIAGTEPIQPLKIGSRNPEPGTLKLGMLDLTT